VISIRPMTAADIALGMRLKQQARWNQLEADWRRALELEPDGCFVAELDGTALGTTTTCVFGSVAWIALVLVDQEQRGRGIGKALLQHALTYLDGRGIPSIRLDATPLGQPLYEKLGFVVEYPLTRYDGLVPASTDAPPSDDVTVLDADSLEEVLALDRAVTATERSKLLRRLFAERPEAWHGVLHAGRLAGFLTTRLGCNAVHVGPCLAMADAGPVLFMDAWQRLAGQRVFIDVPQGNAPAIRWVEARGLTAQRPLMRMCRGPAPAEDFTRIWASFGPEKG
jgi:GNAT superfamily N-acetyltransferase